MNAEVPWRDEPGGPTTWLHIGARETLVASGTAATPEAILVLPIGAEQLAETCFRHDPPTPYELENVISQVEDEVARAHRMLARDSTLVTDNAALRTAARLEGAAPGDEQGASLEAVERLYQDIAAASEAATRHRNEAWSPEGAATALILREFMHHLGFAAAGVAPGDAHHPGSLRGWGKR